MPERNAWRGARFTFRPAGAGRYAVVTADGEPLGHVRKELVDVERGTPGRRWVTETHWHTEPALDGDLHESRLDAALALLWARQQTEP